MRPVKPVLLSRQTFLKGVAGAVAAAGIGSQWAEIPARAENLARPANRLRSQPSSVTVNLSAATGQTIQPDLYGYATGALLNSNFQLAANKAVEKSAETLAPTLIRLNIPASTLIQTVFANGVSHPDWSPLGSVRYRHRPALPVDWPAGHLLGGGQRV
jgi:hypothetical protein